ncbi:hypothetical protein ACG97_07575 [Vogesella sp. EB]|uniref:Transglutaminase superfamily protein n=1 Tax=Vogesella indigofera TaxID=45465 RepID=A0A495BGC9_VOGIN|nr:MULTISPECIES: DUF3488 and transglutaminase-like domain-containing protein [Vogesella]KMJ53581.1 hypothetical protein ACG97_07575 [Vogesella sp. EB]RKQ58745.1 transglutaminase superfamily protein [Vogesella indigofera]
MRSEPRLAHFAVLAALALTVLPLFLQLPPWVPLLFALQLGGRAWLAWQGRQLPHRVWLLLAMIVPVLLLWLSLRTLVGREGGVALLLLLTGFKAFETVTLRDWRVLLGLGFFLAATPLLFDQSLPSALWLLLSLFVLTWAMVLLAGVDSAASPRAAALALLYAMPLMLLLFVAMPRLPGPLWSMPTMDQRATSGLSDSLAPGSIGQMIPSREPAFTAQFRGRQPVREQLYWRVMVFDRFDGARWTAGSVPDSGAALLPGVAGELSYSITATPFKGALPVLEHAVWAGEGVQQVAAQLVRRIDARNEARLRYDVRSVAQAAYPAALSAEQRDHYLQLPAANLRTRQQGEFFARQFRDEAGRLAALRAWLQQQGLRYTLSPPLLQGDVVDDFLFSSRQGFCEHFASAFATLARAAGLPARIVVGFQGGEFNAGGQFWLVRSSDAHAWTEVWLQGRWQRVDPTALVAPSRIVSEVGELVPEAQAVVPVLGRRPPQWWHTVHAQWQRAGFVWQQWVVDYDARRQQSLFQRLGLGRVGVGSVMTLLLLGGVLLVLPLLLWLLWRRPPARSYPVRGWLLLVSRLQQAGVAAVASDTPAQLRDKAVLLAPVLQQQLARLLADWQQWRYAEGATDADPRWRGWWWQVRRFRPPRLAAKKRTGR